MDIPIIQTPNKLGLIVYDTDGVTAIHKETYLFAMGIGLPDFAEVGKETFINVGGVQHKVKIDQKFYTYFFGGDAVTTLLTVSAKKVP
jgi:hypothetical protein